MIRRFRPYVFIVTFLVIAAVGFPATAVRASDIACLELAELPSRAEAVVLAKVLKVTRKSYQSDEATIKVVSVITGSIEQNELKVILQTRGLKGFDPALNIGDVGVFFLRQITGSNAKLAYWGSVAVFQEPNFVVLDESKEPKKPTDGPKLVKLETTMGDIVIELDPKAAPVTVKNFLRYVEEGFYDGTIFHRVIPNFMIQGGGFTQDMVKKQTHKPIVNEANNGLKNNRGTIAMARTPDPNSATSQFFINQKNNNSLNYARNRNPGYAVFGKVVKGMDVVDAIAAVKTTRKGPYSDVPAEPIVIKSAKVVSDK